MITEEDEEGSMKKSVTRSKKRAVIDEDEEQGVP